MRRFNRAVTQQVGALDDHYLSRGRSLGASRVLWEIGERGCDVRTLRSSLDLDSGYLSRLLRSLEADGLVTVGLHQGDRRVRRAMLTAKGRRERAVLDQRSDALARAILEPLSGAHRDRLVAAMADVERLLTAALITIRPTDPAAPDAQHCLGAYYRELDDRFRAGFDVERTRQVELDDVRPPNGVLLVARLRSDAIGCGALRFQFRRPAEIKRMWVDASVRGLGVGRRLLAELESHAIRRGVTKVQLDTNDALGEAIGLYRSQGYREVPAFNDEPYADHWFQKTLARPSRARSRRDQ